MQIVWDPKAIEAQSMAQIDVVLQDTSLPPLEKSVLRRVIHASGDVGMKELVHWSPGACQAGVDALHGGAPVFCDVRMLAAALNRKRMAQYGNALHCAIDDEQVAASAAARGITRAAAAMQQWGQALNGALVAIGNAPTALFTLLEMAGQGVRPALVVGTPVGFVGAAESKELLEQSDLPYITIRGTRGGSPPAGAIMNALLLHEQS